MNPATPHAIAFFCGRKYGGWLLGSSRYPSAEKALRHAQADIQKEKLAHITPVTRRVQVVA